MLYRRPGITPNNSSSINNEPFFFYPVPVNLCALNWKEFKFKYSGGYLVYQFYRTFKTGIFFRKNQDRKMSRIYPFRLISFKSDARRRIEFLQAISAPERKHAVTNRQHINIYISISFPALRCVNASMGAFSRYASLIICYFIFFPSADAVLLATT